MTSHRGANHASSIEYAVQQFCGRVEERILLFAAEVGVSAHWVASRVSTLLSPQGQGIYDQLPAVRGEAPGIRGAMEPLALAEHAHSSEASVAAKGGSTNSSQKNYWAKMTPEERSAEMARRLLVAQKNAKKLTAKRILTPEGRQKIADASRLRWANERKAAKNAAKGSKPGKPVVVPEKRQPGRPVAKKNHGTTNPSKQKIYQARHEARKAGLPLPPLPPSQPSPAAVQ